MIIIVNRTTHHFESRKTREADPMLPCKIYALANRCSSLVKNFRHVVRKQRLAIFNTFLFASHTDILHGNNLSIRVSRVRSLRRETQSKRRTNTQTCLLNSSLTDIYHNYFFLCNGLFNKAKVPVLTSTKLN